MKKGVLFYTTIVLAVMGMMFTVSCAKKAVTTEPAVEEPAAEPAPEPAVEAPAEPTVDPEAEAARLREMEEMRFQNEHIYFEFDSAVLLPEAQNTLRRKAEWLRTYADAMVVVEGHCDERGTNAYNLALGEKRAESAKSFLIDLGISGMRIDTISYGEERPLDMSSNEEAWAKNRRGQFLLQ
ncbi:MAG: peptidoglycan-associated lipoprotein Pal [Desulfobacteraceae bacterium]|nr:peptidoglycan-associated lipoprotein Pal [Desulfobacteraceae bacterium]